MVMAIIYFMGTVSGAHLNPAVTWAFALRGNFPWRRVPGYIVAQAIGAFLACLFLQRTIGATIAVGFEYVLKGRATAAGAEAAQGALSADDTADL
jgi:aquaporin Z